MGLRGPAYDTHRGMDGNAAGFYLARDAIAPPGCIDLLERIAAMRNRQQTATAARLE